MLWTEHGTYGFLGPQSRTGAHVPSVRRCLDPHGCLVHNCTSCALYNKLKTRALKQQSAVTPEASQCTKGNHVVTGEVFFLDSGLLMGVSTRRNCPLKIHSRLCLQIMNGGKKTGRAIADPALIGIPISWLVRLNFYCFTSICYTSSADNKGYS